MPKMTSCQFGSWKPVFTAHPTPQMLVAEMRSYFALHNNQSELLHSFVFLK